MYFVTFYILGGTGCRDILGFLDTAVAAQHCDGRCLYDWYTLYVCLWVCVGVQGVQFDLDSPLTLRLEFARSNTKTTSTKPLQQQQQQQQILAAASQSTAACLHHHTVNTMSLASLTGCKYRDSSLVIVLPKTIPLAGYPKVIPCTKFEHFAIILF